MRNSRKFRPNQIIKSGIFLILDNLRLTDIGVYRWVQWGYRKICWMIGLSHICSFNIFAFFDVIARYRTLTIIGFDAIYHISELIKFILNKPQPFTELKSHIIQFHRFVKAHNQFHILSTAVINRYNIFKLNIFLYKLLFAILVNSIKLRVACINRILYLRHMLLIINIISIFNHSTKLHALEIGFIRQKFCVDFLDYVRFPTFVWI